jgi:hypothetical protein
MKNWLLGVVLLIFFVELYFRSDSDISEFLFQGAHNKFEALSRKLQAKNLNVIQPKAPSNEIAFLEPDKMSNPKISILSQALSFLDIAALHKKQEATKAQTANTIHFLDVDKISQQASSPSKNKPAPTTIAQASTKKGKTEDQNIHFLHPDTSHPKHENSLSHVPIDTRLDSAESEVKFAHRPVSPRLGSDIHSSESQLTLLNCLNQSRCIVPELQLQKKYKIYFCKRPVSYGVRFYFLAREGLLLHPNVQLLPLAEIQQADYVVYLPGSAPWHKSECNSTSFASKLIVLDEFDDHPLFTPTGNREEYIQRYGAMKNPWYALYFKRSFVRRDDGVFKGYPHLHQYQMYPMVYAVAEAYIPHRFQKDRTLEILCTLRGSKEMSTRLRVQNWVGEYGTLRNIGGKKVISGQVDYESRTTISRKYFENMYNAKIIVTVNPAWWEGDFRLWEAMGSGALIFVDPIFVPHAYPLLDKEHVIFFSNQNKTDLFTKLDFYRSHPEEARRVAQNGYLHAMKYHRTVNLMDYILRTAHMKEAMDLKRAKQQQQQQLKNRTAHSEEERITLPDYTYTGQYLQFMAKEQEKMILQCHQPGIYDPIPKIPRDIAGVHHLTSCSS